MQFNFEFKLDHFLGTIYVLPVMSVKGSLDPEIELDEFIQQLSKDIKERSLKYIKEKRK